MNVFPRMQTARTHIRLAEDIDAAAVLAYRIRNRAHLSPWEPSRQDDYYTLEHCRRTIEQGQRVVETERGYPFVVFGADDGDIIATFTLAHVMRGPFQACLLGYGMDAAAQGKGLMHEALQAGLAFAFDQLQLHRVMANYLPRNERSARLLQRLGFEREGYAKKYLQIAGVWEDHILTARTNPGG